MKTQFTEISFVSLSEDAVLPSYANEGDAGLDLHCVEDFFLLAGCRKLVSTGFRVAVPEGYAGLVCPRSGLALKRGVTVLNAPGIIDSTYSGELKVILYNSSEVLQEFTAGSAIAQLVLTPVLSARVRLAKALPESQRGEGGFGSSGR